MCGIRKVTERAIKDATHAYSVHALHSMPGDKMVKKESRDRWKGAAKKLLRRSKWHSIPGISPVLSLYKENAGLDKCGEGLRNLTRGGFARCAQKSGRITKN